MKHLIAVLVFSCLTASAFSQPGAGIKPSAAGTEAYCPLYINQQWVYAFFKKKENIQKDDIPAFINRTVKISGVQCLVYEIPSKGMQYFITKDLSGAYIRSARISLPVFSFITMDIDLEPPLCVLRFPFKDGDSWKYDGTAKVRMLLFVNMEKKLSILFTVAGREKITAHSVVYETFHIHAVSSRRWQDDEPISGGAWIAAGIGVVRAETKNSLLELK